MYIPPELIGIPMVIGIPATVVIVKMWFSHKEKMAGLSAPKENTTVLEARLAAAEQALETMTIDLERVTEQQRFVTKLLTDRAPSSPQGLPAPGR